MLDLLLLNSHCVHQTRPTLLGACTAMMMNLGLWMSWIMTVSSKRQARFSMVLALVSSNTLYNLLSAEKWFNSCSLPLDIPSVPMNAERKPCHHKFNIKPRSNDNELDINRQSSTHWDGTREQVHLRRVRQLAITCGMMLLVFPREKHVAHMDFQMIILVPAHIVYFWTICCKPCCLWSRVFVHGRLHKCVFYGGKLL